MPRYRLVYESFWRDEKVKRLALAEKAVALYVLTAQSNRIGLFYFSLGLACDHLGVKREVLLHHLDTVCHTLSWQYDRVSDTVWIPSWWRWNPPNNRKHLIGCLTDLQSIPRTPFLSMFYENTGDLPAPLIDTVWHTVCRTVCDTVSFPGIISGTGTGTGTGTETEGEEGGARARSRCPDREILAAMREECPALPEVRSWTSARAAQLRARWEEAPERQSLEWWRELGRQITRRSAWLSRRKPGRDGTMCRITLPDLFRAETFARLLEGRYWDEAPAGDGDLPEATLTQREREYWERRYSGAAPGGEEGDGASGS